MLFSPCLRASVANRCVAVNVLMVTSSYPKFPGDVTAPFIESIAHGVAARGHRVDVLLPHHPQLRRGEDEPVRFVPYRYAPRDEWAQWGYAQSLEADHRLRRAAWLLAPLAAFALRRALSQRLQDQRYDVVHVHWLVPNAVLVDDIARAHGAALVISLHGSDVFVAERLALARVLARRALRRAGAVTACSEDLRRRVLALGAPARRACTVPYGVDVHAFAPRAAAPEVRRRLGVGDDSFLVLGLGRLVEKKGFVHLVEAAARTGGVEVVIAGEGDLREELTQRSRALKAPVRLVGALDRDLVAAALAEADVVVVPSVVDRAGNVDGLPNALLEGLATGRPVVATQAGGIPDVVAHDVNGLLVPPGDPDALAHALRRLIREPQTRERLGAEARRQAVERLSWEAAARRFEECYVQAAALDAR
jgi:glycosyltransferase involved in cell wall biosynthesis